jgi:AraC family transcriptional regulator, transcriptional activator of pobA
VGPRPFRSNAPDKASLGFEIFKLSELYDREARGQLRDVLAAPGRLAFHLVFVGLRGEGAHVVDFERCPLGAGFLTVAASGRVHEFVVERGVEAWMILFAPELLDAGTPLAQTDPLRGARVLSPTWTRPVLAVPTGEEAWLLSLCERMREEFERPADVMQPAVLASLVRLVLLGAERWLVAADRGGRERPVPTPLQRFLNAIERDFAQTRSVARYARDAGLSPRRLAELLDAHGYPTAKQLICERVILEQKRLLALADHSVKELAGLTGFEDTTSCVKFFRRHTGLTPVAFRARVRAAR